MYFLSKICGIFVAFIFTKNLLLMFISYYSLGGNIIGYICGIFAATFTKIFRTLGKLFLENISLWEEVVVLKGPTVVFFDAASKLFPTDSTGLTGCP